LGGGAGNGIGTPGMAGIGTLGMAGMGGSVTLGMGGKAAPGTVGTAGMVTAGTVGTAGIGGTVTAGTAEASVVLSARRRAAWQVMLPSTSMSAMTRALVGRLEVDDAIAVLS
jgi:hypothetical protein